MININYVKNFILKIYIIKSIQFIIQHTQSCLMFSAIDVPKSKSISIAFMAFKSMLFGLFLCLSFTQTNNQPQCSDNLVQAILVFKLFFILGSLLDLFLLFYFLCTLYFNRMEYYIMFIFHIIFAAFTAIVCLIQSLTENDCQLKNPFLGTCLALSLVFVVSAFFVMYCNLYFALKFANLGCNIAWTVFWIQFFYCHNIFIASIGVIHGFLSAAGLICFIVMNLLRKNTTTAKFWKQIYILSIMLMIFCYALSFIAQGSSQSCTSARMFILTYQKFGAIQIVAPILLLMFLNTEMGDPRDNILKSEVKVFDKNRQNQNFQIDDTN